MKKNIIFFLSILYMGSVMGCATVQTIMQPPPLQEQAHEAVPLQPYLGSRARLAIADFEVKAAKATREIGSGLREILINVLTNSGRFVVVEPNALAAQARAATPVIEDTTASLEKQEIAAADLIITGAVTEFEPKASGGSSGIGGGGGVGSGMLGGLLAAAVNKSHMSLDIRIFDVGTSEVIASTKIQGQATDGTVNVSAAGLGDWRLTGALAAYRNTPMEKAIRICVIETLRYVSQAVSGQYYKY
ncbi:MAG: hypothetical protein KKC84_01585 [Candidatus Omnitrophica bacterium]|nr:hypothetical protein [Candidatus Omnitrophota bacterium]